MNAMYTFSDTHLTAGHPRVCSALDRPGCGLLQGCLFFKYLFLSLMFYLCTEILVFSSQGLFWISILQHYSNIWVFYSWRAAEICLFRTISLLKIIIDEMITRKAPIRVFVDGTSFHIK